MTTQEAIKIFGSKNKMSKALGISRQAVSKWGDEVPELRMYQIREMIAQGKVAADAS